MLRTMALQFQMSVRDGARRELGEKTSPAISGLIGSADNNGPHLIYSAECFPYCKESEI